MTPPTSGAPREPAQILVLFALALVALLAMAGLALDGGTLLVQRTTARNGADFAALAGARALSSATSSDSSVATAVCTYVLKNRFGTAPTATAAFVDSTGNWVGAITLTPSCSGSQSNSIVPSTANGVQVNVTIGPYPTYLAGILGLRQLTAQASATASLTGAGSGTFLSLNASACPAMYVTGGVTLTVTNGNVQVNSSCASRALQVDNGATIRTLNGVTDVVGGSSVSAGSVTPAPVTGTVLADPMANLAIPSVTGLSLKGAATCSGGSMTLNPGIYPLMSAANGCSLVLTSGNYIIGSAGNPFSLQSGSVIIGASSANTTIVLLDGMTIFNGEILTGYNVLFYNACLQYASDLPGGCVSGDTFGAMTLTGGDWSKVTPQASGTYANMPFFQDRHNPQPMTMNNGVKLQSGTIYGQTMPVDINGGAIVPDQFVADTFNLSNGATSDNVVSTQEWQGAKSVAISH